MAEPWFKNGVIYAVDVRVFQDSNGDGIGDFAGLTSRLDYLVELGVTCLWVLPFFPTPMGDNGYDIQNYVGVDPHVGDLQAFARFREQAEAHGIQVVIDLVINHTSNKHPWFLAAERDRESRYHGYYVWSDTPHEVPEEQQPIFPGAEDEVWSYSEQARRYYYHRFYHFQPELDGRNPQVREEIAKILDFWLAFGVAGFRVDAASHLIENKGAGADEPVTHDYALLGQLYQQVAQRRKDVFLMGEADVEPELLPDFFGKGDRLTLLLNFLLSQYIFLALAEETAQPISKLLSRFPAVPEQGQWANFLRNLDELDLERLSKQDQRKVFEAFAPEEHMRIYGRGIRRRLAPMLNGDRQRIELAYSLLFAQPGIPVIVYGDELGMGDDLEQPQRSAVRPPMQWSNETNGGFSEAPLDKLIRRPIADGRYGYHRLNAAAQRSDPCSLLSWMRRLIELRKRCPEPGSAACRLLESDSPPLLAQLYGEQEPLLVVHNLSGRPASTRLHLEGQIGRAERLFGNAVVRQSRGQGSRIDLEPYGYGWFRLNNE